MGYRCKWTQHLLTMKERYTHSQVSALIHSRWQKECRTTKEKMEEATPMKTEQAWMAAAAAYDDDDDVDKDDDYKEEEEEEGGGGGVGVGEGRGGGGEV
jgi:hypothetical protein